MLMLYFCFLPLGIFFKYYFIPLPRKGPWVFLGGLVGRGVDGIHSGKDAIYAASYHTTERSTQSHNNNNIHKNSNNGTFFLRYYSNRHANFFCGGPDVLRRGRRKSAITQQRATQ